jgi:hypothetical protein
VSLHYVEAGDGDGQLGGRSMPAQTTPAQNNLSFSTMEAQLLASRKENRYA